MSGPNPNAIIEAVRDAFRSLGVSGEIQVSTAGLRSTSWLGKASGEDILIRVSVSPMPLLPEDAPASPRPIGVSRDAENRQAIIVSFTEPLNDDQLRAFHETVRDVVLA